MEALQSVADLEARLAPTRAAVCRHDLYRHLNSVAALRQFMAHHVFAVWDFMTVLKTLQLRLTGMTLPWTPPASRDTARFINDIVLGEESDEIEPGLYLSHLELYIQAMEEVGASTKEIQSLLQRLQAGEEVQSALRTCGAPKAAREFSQRTLEIAAGSTIGAASAFLHGREEIIPEMFEDVLKTLANSGIHCPSLKRYLERHIEVDSGHHGPLGRKLLASLCNDQPGNFQLAAQAAEQSLSARTKLWDGVLGTLRQEFEEATETAPSTPGVS